jgi:hypothetical protein
MIDPDEAADLRHADRAQRQRDKALVAHVWSRSQFDEQFPDDGEYRNPNQPRCTVGANGALAARRAIEAAQNMEKNK